MKLGIQIGMIFCLIIVAVSTPNAASGAVQAGSKSQRQFPVVVPHGGGGPACLPDGTGCT
jgi:hypothetical protein